MDESKVREFIEQGLCPVCERGPFKLLGAHTAKAHGIYRHELRDMAGMMMRESTASKSFTSRARELAVERNFGESPAAAIGRMNRTADQRMTKAGARKRAEGTRERMLAIPKHERSAHAAFMSQSRTQEGLARIGAAARGRPRTKAEIEAFKRAVRSPAAIEKRVASVRQNLQPCGTVAAYKRGCRCEPCKEAKRISRRKGGSKSGEAHGNAKLSDQEVATIRNQREAGARLRDLASEFNVSESTISLIVRGLSRAQRKETE